MKYCRKSEQNVRDIALRLCLQEEQERKTNPNETHERSIIIVGSKRVVRNILTKTIITNDLLIQITLHM